MLLPLPTYRLAAGERLHLGPGRYAVDRPIFMSRGSAITGVSGRGKKRTILQATQMFVECDEKEVGDCRAYTDTRYGAARGMIEAEAGSNG